MWVFLPVNADFWVKKTDNSARCLLCPRVCIINTGQEGWCGVRAYQNENLIALTYGRISSANPDPIEKKPLYHFYPGSDVFSIGGVGCNLGCLNCQNWNISQAKPDDYLRDMSPKQVIELTKQSGCISWAATYNEPTIWLEYVRDIGKLASQNKIKTVLVTNGYITPKALQSIAPLIDGANIDIKGISDYYFQEICLAPSVKPILKTAKTMKSHGVHVEVTNLIIPGKNDTEDQITDLIDWIYHNLGPSTPTHFSRFYPHYQMCDIPRTPISTLENAYKIAIDRGLHYVYLGNVPGHSGNHTYCPGCGTRLIRRIGFDIKEYKITSDNRCSACDMQILLRGYYTKKLKNQRFR